MVSQVLEKQRNGASICFRVSFIDCYAFSGTPPGNIRRVRFPRIKMILSVDHISFLLDRRPRLRTGLKRYIIFPRDLVLPRTEEFHAPESGTVSR